jgi:hypothetical protein
METDAMTFDTSGNYNGNFDYDTQPPQSVMVDAIAAATENALVPIISETDGGIVGYALGIEHATAIVRALNAAEGEYEAEMVAFAANR